MQEQIDTLKRNISLHKQIEKQLAKRAHMSQGQIANLKRTAEQLEAELSEHIKRVSAQRPQTNDQNGEALIDFLEQKLEQIEVNFQRSQEEYEQLQQDCIDVQEKLDQSKEKYRRAALLMTEFLHDALA